MAQKTRTRPAILKLQKSENLNEPDFWMLPDVHKLSSKKAHEKAKGDLYVAFARVCDEWYTELQLGEGLRADCSMDYQGTRFHFEVDLGTETWDELKTKIDRYIQYSERGEKTIFVLADGPRRTAKATHDKLNVYLSERKRGRQFSWTMLDWITTKPFAPCLVNSLHEQLTIDDLCVT
jgi:hypothetical protein